MTEAPISNISHASTEDGAGLRTVVFLAGCNMNCLWCHNPESISHAPRLMIYSEKCIGCLECSNLNCPAMPRGAASYEASLCRACGECEALCLGDAIRLSSRKMSAEEVFSEVLRDAPFYKFSGGGLTLSGGECLLYPDFAEEILTRSRTSGISTCIETALFVPRENIERVIGLVDKLFIDLKLFDCEEHKKYTGVSNRRILENAKWILEAHKDVTVRVPLIPRVTDTEKNLRDIAAFLSSVDTAMKRELELLRYNPLAEAKYEALGKKHRLFGEAHSDARLRELADGLSEAFPNLTVKYR